MKITNSLTNKKEEFIPQKPNKIKMYVCGITPYDTTHLGHAFTYIFFDTLRRYLKFQGFKVQYTQNVTDIDDDILKKAKEVSLNWRKLGKIWTKKYTQDMESLNIEKPTFFVKATNSIKKIIDINKNLLKRGFAYEKKGNLFFRVDQAKKYGKLSKLTREEMIKISAQRGADPKDPNKINPLDFLLWQKSKENEPGWISPWGKGRPGWHIECSAMIHEFLGDQIDIHGGGMDLIFPHHESEIAQSESYTNKSPFVKYWLHTAMLRFKGEKMSKSLGNLVMVSELLKKYSPNSIRYLLLSFNHTKEWEFDDQLIERAAFETAEIEKLLKSHKNSQRILLKKISFDKIFKKNSYYQELIKVLDNDLDTKSALTILSRLAKELTTKKVNKLNIELLNVMYKLLGFKI